MTLEEKREEARQAFFDKLRAQRPDRLMDWELEMGLPGVKEHPDVRHSIPNIYVISGEDHYDERPGQGYVVPFYTTDLKWALIYCERREHDVLDILRHAVLTAETLDDLPRVVCNIARNRRP